MTVINFSFPCYNYFFNVKVVPVSSVDVFERRDLAGQVLCSHKIPFYIFKVEKNAKHTCIVWTSHIHIIQQITIFMYRYRGHKLYYTYV